MKGPSALVSAPLKPIRTMHSCTEKRNPSPETRSEIISDANQVSWRAAQQRQQQERNRSKGSVYQWDDARLQKAKVCTTKLDRAAVVVQRFFLQSRSHAQIFQEQQRVLAARLEAIETARQQELETIAQDTERRKIQARRTLQEDNRKSKVELLQQPIEKVLKVAGNIVAELKSYKKRNAFLQRRCSELRRDNFKLRAEIKQNVLLQKLPRVISSRIAAIDQYQCRVADYQSRFALAEKQWQAMKLANKRIRDCMGKIIRSVEERQPESDDKWDLVDELYQLRRGTQWKRKCNASVKSRRRCLGSPPSSRPKQVQAYFPRNSPRMRSSRGGSNSP